MRTFDDMVQEQLTAMANNMAWSLKSAYQNREDKVKFIEILQEHGFEPAGLITARLTDLQSFARVAPLLEALEAAGFTATQSTDYPYNKNRDFTFEGPHGDIFYIYCYLAQDSECELVEISREPQPDKIIYEMRCKEEQENAS